MEMLIFFLYIFLIKIVDIMIKIVDIMIKIALFFISNHTQSGQKILIYTVNFKFKPSRFMSLKEFCERILWTDILEGIHIKLLVINDLQ